MKSILLYVANDRGMTSRLQVALDIARRCDGHLSLLQTEPYQNYVAVDMLGGAHIMEDVLAASKAIHAENRQRLDKLLANEAVQWDWMESPGGTVEMLVEASRFADLIVLSRGEGDALNRNVQRSIIGDVVSEAGRPVLMVPEKTDNLRFDRAMIAYDGSAEAANAIRGALPMLSITDVVHLVEVEEKKSEFPLTDAASYLARNGVSCQIQELERGRQDISETLMQYADSFKPDYLVMGAYGHSRLKQTLFGGVTRHMLSEAKFPLLLGS